MTFHNDALRAAWAVVYDPLEGDDWDEVRGSDALWEMGYDSFTVFPGWATERAVQADLVREVFGKANSEFKKGKDLGKTAQKEKRDYLRDVIEKNLAPLAALRQNPRWRYWISRARWYNNKNGLPEIEVPIWLIYHFSLRDGDFDQRGKEKEKATLPKQPYDTSHLGGVLLLGSSTLLALGHVLRNPLLRRPPLTVAPLRRLECTADRRRTQGASGDAGLDKCGERDEAGWKLRPIQSAPASAQARAFSTWVRPQTLTLTGLCVKRNAQLREGRLEFRFGVDADQAINFLATVEDQDGRDGRDPQAARGILVLVGVHLADLDLALEFARELLDRRCEHPARAAPWSPEVNHHRDR